MPQPQSIPNPAWVRDAAQVATQVVVYGTVLALAVVPAWRRRSAKVLLRSVPVAVFAVAIPLAVFLLSASFSPEWKGGAPYGWVSTFHEGKLALTPLVLWAVAALYAFELGPTEKRNRPWSLAGIVVGALVSVVCLAHGLATIPLRVGRWGFVVPSYVALWYTLRSAQIVRARLVQPIVYLYSLLGSVPFWIWSVVLSRQLYRELPEDPPKCFIVTAASRGHAGLVGSWTVTGRGGQSQTVNAQLAVFWQLEDLGRRRFPRVHATFRRVYDIWGYRAAALVRNRWAADALYCALRPLELAARAVLMVAGERRGARPTPD